MTIQRIVACALAVVMTLGAAPVLAQQAAAGSVGGSAGDKAKAPYSNWVVQLRDVTTGQVVNTTQITVQGTFSITGVALSRPYLLELVQVQERRIACTQGPFTLTPASPSKGSFNMSCNKTAQSASLLAAGLGAAAAVALATRSSSK